MRFPRLSVCSLAVLLAVMALADASPPQGPAPPQAPAPPRLCPCAETRLCVCGTDCRCPACAEQARRRPAPRPAPPVFLPPPPVFFQPPPAFFPAPSFGGLRGGAAVNCPT